MVTDIPEHTEVNLFHLSGHIMSPPIHIRGQTWDNRDNRDIGVRDHGKEKTGKRSG